MSALVGNLRNQIIAAVLLGLVVPRAYCHAYQLRGGGGGRSILQRALGSRQGDGSGQRALGNRSSDSNGPAKRVLAGKNGNSSSQQPAVAKSKILEKYGESTHGNWTSLGRTPATAPAQPSPGQQVITGGKPFTPPGPSPAVADQSIKSPAPAVAGAAVAGAAVAGAAIAAPAVAGPKPNPAPIATAATAGDVDLVLEDVKYIEPATETAGPAYRMKLRNQGARAAGKFRIGAFAEREGKLSDDAPQVVTEIASLPAGGVRELTLRLPVSAVRFVTTSSSEPVAFDQLLVVVDLDNSIVESDKSNNVASLERTELEAAVK
jgi:hypothetical protein